MPTKKRKQLAPIHPGEMLREDLLVPLGLSANRLARDLRVPVTRISEILRGRRGITADTDLRLCRFFGLSDGWWLRLQADYDTQVARSGLSKVLAKIKPWASHPGRKEAA